MLNIDINQGNVQPMPIALPDFLSGGPAEGDIGRNVTGVISNNLQRSGLFAPINPAAFIEKITNTDSVPRFPDWRSINAQALVTGRITRQGDGRLKAEFRLWDVFAGQQLDGKQYFTTPDNWRRIAHIISDAIYERLTGEKGYFDSRVVFVDETGPKDRRVKRLAIMDQDGASVRYLTRGDDLVLTPRFNPSTQEITYMSYGQGDPRVYLLNIETGQREIVGNFPGMTFAPRFSPDGQRVIMSLQQGGNANLFVMDLRSKQTTRLTDTPAIDTAPCYSPDGQRICFESDRGGTQQIYVMAASGGPAQRISFGEGITARDHEPAAGRQRQSVRDGSALEADDAAHRHAGDRHRAVLFAGRHAHLLRERPRRHAADLCDGGERRPGAAHQLRRGPSFDAGVVAARRLHRLHGPGARAISRSASSSPTVRVNAC